MTDDNNANKQDSVKDWTGILGLVVGVIGILLSIYFYILSEKEKSLSIIVDQEAIPIIDTTKIQSNKFSVVDRNGGKIEGDISAFKIKILNDGEISIWNKSILSPLEIYFFETEDNESYGFPYPVAVLDYSVEKSSRSEIIAPEVNFSESNSTFNVKFKILEPNDEISLTVIFQGAEIPFYRAKGAIEGLTNIKTNERESNYQNYKKTYGFIVTATIISLSMILSAQLTKTVSKKLIRSNFTKNHRNAVEWLTLLVSFLVFILVMIRVVVLVEEKFRIILI